MSHHVFTSRLAVKMLPAWIYPWQFAFPTVWDGSNSLNLLDTAMCATLAESFGRQLFSDDLSVLLR